MKKNTGDIDRILRLFMGLTLLLLLLGKSIPTPAESITLWIISLLMLTGVIGICPLYAIFRINTRTGKTNHKDQQPTKQ